MENRVEELEYEVQYLETILLVCKVNLRGIDREAKQGSEQAAKKSRKNVESVQNIVVSQPDLEGSDAMSLDMDQEVSKHFPNLSQIENEVDEGEPAANQNEEFLDSRILHKMNIGGKYSAETNKRVRELKESQEASHFRDSYNTDLSHSDTFVRQQRQGLFLLDQYFIIAIGSSFRKSLSEFPPESVVSYKLSGTYHYPGKRYRSG